MGPENEKGGKAQEYGKEQEVIGGHTINQGISTIATRVRAMSQSPLQIFSYLLPQEEGQIKIDHSST